jgi:3-hydroxybutyrate dehydrogenase
MCQVSEEGDHPMTQPAALQDKVALVTGAASGIGKEIAHTFARAGARIVIADLNLAGARAVAQELSGNEQRAIGLAMDVTDEEQVGAGMAKAVESFGRLDILVSNAGIQIVAPLEDFAFADWKRLLAIHLDGAFLTTRAALRQMYAQGGLAKVVAKEGAAHGVRANVICPGFVRTPLVEKQIPEQAKELGISEERVMKEIMLRETVDGEFTTVDDVAEAALFFASFESNALTGQSLIVSHGWSMQ